MAKFRSLKGILSSHRTPAVEGLEALEPRQMLAAQAVLPASAVETQWNGQTVAQVANQWLISFDAPQSASAAELLTREAATRLGVTIGTVKPLGLGYTAVFTTNDRFGSDAARAAVAAIPGLSSITPDTYSTASALPNDTFFNQQWHLRNTGQSFNTVTGSPSVPGVDINVVSLWNQGFVGTKSVVVAVLDTGVETTHPDLAPNMYINPNEIAGNGIDDDGDGYVDDVTGWDFFNNDRIPDDVEGHGTSVAGLIGAKGNNSIGVSGVNWDVSIIPLRVASDQGAFPASAVISANDYLVMLKGRGVNIVASNNSFGGPGYNAAQEASFVRLGNAGIIPVISAGNGGPDGVGDDNDITPDYPSSFTLPLKISVAATDESDGITGFSNYGLTSVDIGAPGSNNIVTTATGSRYIGDFSGTSAAAPIVTGAIALLKQARPDASPSAIKDALLAGAKRTAALQGRVVSGGTLDVAKALQILNTAGPVLTGVTPGPVTNQVDTATGLPLNTISLTFSKALLSTALSTSGASLIFAGTDRTFGTGDDVTVPVSSFTFDDAAPTKVSFTLNLSGPSFPSSRLPIGNYRLTLAPTAFRDNANNQLNGNVTSGVPEVYNFEVRASTGENEPNDTLAVATSLAFTGSSSVTLTGLTLGNGVAGALDVDLYRVTMTSPGQIKAELFAQRLPSPSPLDGLLRLFNARGEQLAINDQTFGNDPAIDFYVPTGGSYYVGVSGFGNSVYNPAVAASGSAQSLGVYNLAVTVVATSNDQVVVPYTESAVTPVRPALPIAVPPPIGGSPATAGITTSFISVTDSRQIQDLNVRVNIAHAYDSDLVISLIGPDGTTVILSNRRGGSSQDFGTRTVNPDSTVTLGQNTEFDDDTPVGIGDISAAAPFVGAYKPDQPLGAFDTKTANGIWTLRVNDTTIFNAGQLWDWSLVFTFATSVSGPFESNDTIATAYDLTTQLGTNNNAVNLPAFIGDGGFGNLDRDIFKFTVGVGTTLRAVADPANAADGSPGLLDTLIRLFDSTGRELAIADPTDTQSSLIAGFVFSAGGTYYVAVSEASNKLYNPLVVGDASGVPAATTGNYTLNLSLSSGVSDASAALTGSKVRATVGTSGLFEPVGGTRLALNNLRFLNAADGQFLGAVASSNAFTNVSGSATNLPFAVTNLSDTAGDSAFSPNNTAVTVGDYRSLRIERRVSFGANDSFVAIDLTLRNAGATTLSGVQWMEGFNPNIETDLNNFVVNTQNDLSPNGRFVSARVDSNAFPGGLTVALAAATSETRARAAALDPALPVFRDPAALLAYMNANPASIDPDGATGDRRLAMHLNAGDIAPGASTSFRYFILLGTTRTSVDALYDQINTGTGPGHLTKDPASPATEVISTGGAGTAVPTLPYRVYYPEGFAGQHVFTFVPITNSNNAAAKVVVIARYEDQGDSQPRDQVLSTLTIPANSRSGITLTTPDLFASGSSLFRPNSPYAVEVRSSLPVSAVFSHYDLEQLARPAAVGEAFTSRTSSSWSFGQVTKFPTADQQERTFLLFYNTTNIQNKVVATFYPTGGGTPIQAVVNLAALRRGGLAINDLTQLPVGDYGVVVQAEQPVVASMSRYNVPNNSAEGIVGNVGVGASAGVIPEGQFGLNATQETLGVVNTNNTVALVTFAFTFTNGSVYRTNLSVPAGSFGKVDVGSLPGFPTGTPYAVSYTSTLPVSFSMDTEAFNDSVQAAAASRAFTAWGFGEGFRPADGSGHPGVVDYLRIYNPSSTDAVIEISIVFDDGASGGNRGETFRRTVSGRGLAEFNVDQFVTGARRSQNSFYGIQVKSPTGIVAYMGHFDRLFPGAFGTLGTPLGIGSTIT